MVRAGGRGGYEIDSVDSEDGSGGEGGAGGEEGEGGTTVVMLLEAVRWTERGKGQIRC